jgi:hypothetical protein
MLSAKRCLHCIHSALSRAHSRHLRLLVFWQAKEIAEASVAEEGKKAESKAAEASKS